MFNARFFTGLLLLSGLAGCGDGQDAGRSGFSPPQTPLFATEGLAGPESVHYDAEQDVYFVGNFNGAPTGDANGFVSKVSADGEMLVREFMTGTEDTPLHGARGMAIEGDIVWVTDELGLHGFDRMTGQHRAYHDLSSLEPGFLNDVVVTDDGVLYVTDTRGERLIEIVNGTPTVIETPYKANGVVLDADNNRLILMPWSGSTTYASWSRDTREFATFGKPDGGGHFDGGELVDGGLLAASQDDRQLHYLKDGTDRAVISLAGDPADIGYDTRRGIVAVPYVALDRVEFFRFPEGAGQ